MGVTVRLGDRLQCPGYAVVGVETSGLSPHRHRIVEIAVALCDPDGAVTDFFTTLLNPDGPVGDFQAHGLFDDDVVDAPAFAAVAPWLAGLLRQRVVVAHNARFELGFLEREFQRRRHPSMPPLTMLCTMREAPEHVPEAPRFTLLACCEAASVPVDAGYGAAAKAMGAARLLAYYLSQGAGEARHWQQARTVAASLNWPRRKAEPPRVYTRDDAHAARRAREEAEQARRRVAVSYLEKARAYGPPTGVGEGPDSYLAVLDAALEDRVITPEEAADLAELAVSLGISEAQRKDLDRLYVTTLAASMVAAGPVIDREERADLTRVAAQLGIPRIALDDIIAMARDTAADQTAGGTPVPGGSRILARGRAMRPGQHVLFHGYLAVTRAELEQRLALARLELASGIHDRVDVLVVADPDESADRTYWARQRGIRVLIEPVFLALLADLERERGSAADAASRVAAAGALAHAGAAAHSRTTSGFLLPRPGASGPLTVWADDPTEDVTRDESVPSAAAVPVIPPPPPPSVTAALNTASAPPDTTPAPAAPTRRPRNHRGLTPPAPNPAAAAGSPAPAPQAGPPPDTTAPDTDGTGGTVSPPPPKPTTPAPAPVPTAARPESPLAAPAEDARTSLLPPPPPSEGRRTDFLPPPPASPPSDPAASSAPAEGQPAGAVPPSPPSEGLRPDVFPPRPASPPSDPAASSAPAEGQPAGAVPPSPPSEGLRADVFPPPPASPPADPAAPPAPVGQPAAALAPPPSAAPAPVAADSALPDGRAADTAAPPAPAAAPDDGQRAGAFAPPRPADPPPAAGAAAAEPADGHRAGTSPPPPPPASVPPAPDAPPAAPERPAPAVPPPPAASAEEPRALIRGQAVTIDQLGTFTGALRVEAAWWGPEAVDADVVVLVLDDDRRAGGDEDLVFYNQPVHPSGAVRLAGKLQDGQPGSDSVDIDVTRLPAGRVRVLVALALDAATGTAFAQVPVAIGIVDPVTRRRLADFRLTGGEETVMILTEVYRRGDSWRLRAVGQGYAEGLAALVTEHGVVVDE